MRRLKYLVFFSCVAAFGGQSIQLSTETAGASVPGQPVGNNYRVEYSIHDWDSNAASGHPLIADAVGLNVQFLNLGSGDLRVQMYTQNISVGPLYQVCQFQIGNLPTKFVTVRFQEDGANKVDYCQAWDINGNLINNISSTYTVQGGVNPAGAFAASTGENLSTAYFRIYTSLVGTNARPPVTADTTSDCLVIWKFDLGNNTGSLNDSCSAGPYNAVMSAGSPVYVPTPGQSLVVPVLKTMDAPLWGNTASFRAGFPGQLDATASYSQADASTSVSCFWQALSGPSSVAWDNQASCTPTVQDLTFGDYNFELVATDVNGSQVTASQDIGAVATDLNGVVVNADPNVDFIFGPMIALGKNPWGYQDYWALHASQLRLADYLNQGWIQGPAHQPQWEYTGQGTVSYYFNCIGLVGFCNTSLGTTLAANYVPGNATITVDNAAALDLTSFPTHIILFNGTSNEIRICSASGNVLTLCYDGADQAPLSFGTGQNVLQSKLIGAGTKFLTDPTAPVCPLGAPGPPGPSAYSTGTVALTPNSRTVIGSGTTWTSALVNGYVRIHSTHDSMAFVFVARIAAVNSPTSLTLTRVYPADADAVSGLAYDIMAANRTLVLRYPHATDATGLGELMFGAPGGCESETAVYTNPVFAGNAFSAGHDLPSVDGVHVIGTAYSITDTTGWVNQSSFGGISFYGESLAHRVLYYRSGLTAPLTAANYVSDFWIKSPWANADGNGTPRLFLGGEGIGSFVAAVLAGRGSWSDLRGYGTLGTSMVNGIASLGCNGADDTRDSGYAYAWLILAAIYDPDTTGTGAPGGIAWRTYWQNQLAQMRANDTSCQGADGSFANAFYFNVNSPSISVTNGEALATGSGLPSTMCNGTASGTAGVRNGSNAITILANSVPAGTNTLFLTGTKDGEVFVQSVAYSDGVLGAVWEGDFGTVTWVSGNFNAYPSDARPQDMLTIALNNDDLINLKKSWACTWNAPDSITLNRAWDGPSGTYHAYGQNLAGFGQQPFMLGIKTYGENLLATQTAPALSSFVAPYQSFTTNSTSWIWNVGMDHQLLGTSYGRIFQQCEPANTSPAGTSFTFRAAGCTYGNDPAAVFLSREQNSETGAAHAIYYQNNPSNANKHLGDQFYGALWGYCPWTIGVYCDANSTAANARASNLGDSSIEVGKWTGFFTGVGMSHRWPAARVGGVQPPHLRTVWISVRMADVPAAASVNVLITAPSGAQSSFLCSSEPCVISVDDRQGAHLYEIQYLSSGGAVLSQSQPGLMGAQ